MDAHLTAEPEGQLPEPVSLDTLAQLLWPRLSRAIDGDAAASSSQSKSQSNSELINSELINTKPITPGESPEATAGLSPAAIARLSPTALAYIGDAVYELHIRSQFLFPPQRQHAYHRQVVAQVRAEKQAETLAHLDPLLTDPEKDWVRRGRNSVGKRSRHSNPAAYRQATGFEALVGYLFLSDPARLNFLLDALRDSDPP